MVMRLWVTWILLPSTTDSDLEAEGCLQSSVLMLMCLSVYDDTLLLHYYHDYMLTVMYKLILKIRQEISLCMMLVKYVTASPSTTGRRRGGGETGIVIQLDLSDRMVLSLYSITLESIVT